MSSVRLLKGRGGVWGVWHEGISIAVSDGDYLGAEEPLSSGAAHSLFDKISVENVEGRSEYT